MRPGEIVEFRSLWEGVPRWQFPMTVVADDGDLLVTYLAPGARGYWIPRGSDFRERWIDPGTEIEPHTWNTHHVLWLTHRGAAHALGLFWNVAWELQCWYVNLQLPIDLHDSYVDSCDQALDVVVEPDGRWSWKDEEDLAKFVELGAFSDEDAAAIRAEGERVIAAKPWPTGWEDWRP
jgi:hypothetical protein